MNKLKKLFSGGLGFAVMAIAAKVIGVLYRLPLTGVLGAEGMGLYQTVFPFYALLLTLSCGGIPAAISRYVSINRQNARRALMLSLLVVGLSGLILTVAVILFKDSIAALQGNKLASVAYLGIAPAILLSGMIACFRGYFQGKNNMLHSGISQLLEQCVKAVVGIVLAIVLLPRGVEFAVFGSCLGIAVSEFIALTYLVFMYNLQKHRRTLRGDLAFEAASDVASKQVLRDIYSTALPITLSSLILPLTLLVDSLTVVNILSVNMPVAEATALYGIFSGPVTSLINMPTVVATAFSASLLPLAAKGKINAVEWSNKVLCLLMPCAVVFALLPQPILEILYGGGLSDSQINLGSALLFICSLSVPAMGCSQIASAIMQGEGRQKVPLINLLIGGVVKVVLTVILLPILGIYGSAIGSLVCYLTVAAINIARAGHKMTNKTSAYIIVFSIIFGVFAYALYCVFSSVISSFAAFFTAVCISFAGYIIIMLKNKIGFVSE